MQRVRSPGQARADRVTSRVRGLGLGFRLGDVRGGLLGKVGAGSGLGILSTAVYFWQLVFHTEPVAGLVAACQHIMSE
jgi:hypothetical protein